MTAQDLTKRPLGEEFRASMRVCAASVSLVTGRDQAGAWHGMAVTSAGSLSMDPPSMMVAINRSASIYPVISETGQFTLNLMGENHLGLLDRFSRSDMRDQRFSADDWEEGPHGQPILRGALSAVHYNLFTTAALFNMKTAKMPVQVSRLCHQSGFHHLYLGTLSSIVNIAVSRAIRAKITMFDQG